MRLSLLILFLMGSLASAQTELYLSNRVPLGALQKNGLALSEVLCAKKATTTRQLQATCPPYAELVKVLQNSIRERGEKARSRIPEAPLDVFESRWLGANDTTFVLTGIVNRMDRHALMPGTCGELRLVYRLVGRYQEKAKTSSTYLPLNIMVVHELPARLDCAVLARDLLQTGNKQKLEIGIRRVRKTAAIRIEVNLLNLRIPSPVLEKSAGYAEYLLRVFSLQRGKLTPLPLENTPNREKLRANRLLQREFEIWVENNLPQIDDGRAILPEKFCAVEAVSVAPFGAQREVNAPYSGLLKEDFLKKLDLRSFHHTSSPERLLRRLNGSSCQGCHQTKSDAGFHFLGESLSDSFVFNRTLLPASAHFFSEQEWRKKSLRALLEKKPPPPRPFPGRADSSSSGVAGDVCTLSDGPAGFNCQKGFSCRHPWEQGEHRELNVGYCQKQKAPIAGEPCLLGNWTNKGGLDDALEGVLSTGCFGRAQCLPHSIGFPGGLCVSSCDNLLEGTACHPVPALQKFADCRARAGSLSDCFEEAATRVALRTCGIDMPCRPDYVCALREAGDETKGGACVPPYFLLQLNTRGHSF